MYLLTLMQLANVMKMDQNMGMLRGMHKVFKGYEL